MQRRTFLGSVGVGVAAVAVGLPSVAGVSGESVRPAVAVASPDAQVVERLLGSLVARPVGFGFRVDSVSAIDRGAVTVLLRRGEETAMVRVFARSAASSGVATSRIFDLRLMNGADGVEGTNERVGVAVMTLGARVARLERAEPATYARAARQALVDHDTYLRLHGGTPPAVVT